MRYKAVVFDFDGTIVDSEIGIAKAFQRALNSQGIEEDLEVIKSLIGPPLSRTIITKYGLSEEDGAKAMKIHREYYNNVGVFEGQVFKNVMELLKKLQSMGVKMMVATNKPEESALKQIEHFKLKSYFSAVVGNNANQTRGTKADFINLAMKETGVFKDETLMVGDRFNDIEAGREVGLDTVGVTYGYGSVEEIEKISPTYTIDDPLKLIDIVTGEV